MRGHGKERSISVEVVGPYTAAIAGRVVAPAACSNNRMRRTDIRQPPEAVACELHNEAPALPNGMEVEPVYSNLQDGMAQTVA